MAKKRFAQHLLRHLKVESGRSSFVFADVLTILALA
ncbi:hypothetical protein GGD45_001417 [Rhizobium tropici]|uniref:Uncharacterized protein n=1 Tax=Rhizobium tropici TaxID=398 RepID=A0ABR6QVQ9_RHITR|nr:hypothetical protein [Rhizobium tropici]MBB6491020.1 hypothetical protein [Rhizobium tropici]